MDGIRATPYINPLLGSVNELVGGLLGYMRDPRRTQQLQGLAGLLESTGVPKTLERLAYGEPLTNIQRANVPVLRPETAEALLTLSPVPQATSRAAMAAGRAGERMAERVVPQIMERGGMPAGLLESMSSRTVSPLTVYHGSPHKFEKFDASKIGTGEGAQSYGYGHYVAEAPGVAAQYRKQLAPGFIRTVDDVAFDSSNPQHMAASYMEMFGKRGKSPEQIAQMLSEGGHNEAAQIVLRGDKLGQIGEQARGALYTIDLPDPAIARMLDWDKPLNQQSEFVKNALLSDIDQAINITKKSLETASERRRPSTLKDLSGFERERNRLLGLTGQKLYQELSLGESRFAPSASSKLRDIGIPGIRYLDQGSRSNFSVQNLYKGQPYGEPVSFMTELQAKEYAAEQVKKGFETKMVPGTSNFVIFPGEEDLLTILRRNGGLLGP